ncbi:MAG: hypothetical protein ACE3NC_06670 [Candidatus Wallacebacter cryptica]|jgi:hypothetical protein|nr:hypothetical protein [Bacillota bacterium]
MVSKREKSCEPKLYMVKAGLLESQSLKPEPQGRLLAALFHYQYRLFVLVKPLKQPGEVTNRLEREA